MHVNYYRTFVNGNAFKQRGSFYFIGLLFWSMVLIPFSGIGHAFQQPPLNLASTSYFDGGPVQPGVHFAEYVISISGRKAIDHQGEIIPGNGRVSALVSLNQIFVLTPIKIFGANVGIDSLLPVSSASGSGSLGSSPITFNRGGVGDLAIGPALQWNNGKLGAIPFFSRFEVYCILPTGRYDKNYMVNPGSNLTTWEGYYSFTTFLSPKTETSWRFLYGVHGYNEDLNIKPGQVFHLNYAISQSVTKKWKVGFNGYFLKQVTNDMLNGDPMADSKERVTSIGPGLVYLGEGLTFMLNHPIEFGVRNRFSGERTTLQLIHKF